MSSELELFRYGSASLRVAVIDGRRWAVAADICAVLGIGHVASAMGRVAEQDKLTLRRSEGVGSNHTFWGSVDPRIHAVALVSEDGATELVLESRKPEARTFRRWLTHEVWPSIRDTGSYGTVAVEPLTGIEYARALLAAEERALEAQERAEEAEEFKRCIEAGEGLALTDFHKKYFSAVPHTKFFDHLYAKHYLIDQRGKGTEREDGTFRDGPQHRKPGWRGKPFFYLHGGKDRAGARRENTRVRPGSFELALREELAKDGLPANETAFELFAIEGGRIRGELS